MEIKVIKVDSLTRTMRKMMVGDYFKRSSIDENTLRRNASLLRKKGYDFDVVRSGVEITVTCTKRPLTKPVN